MIDQAKFFSCIRKSLFDGKLLQHQVDGIGAILNKFYSFYPLPKQDLAKLAYILATVHHETAQTMQPIEEYGRGKGKRYAKKVRMDGQAYIAPDQVYYGRGLVQLTWYENYRKFEVLVGKPLLDQPNLLLEMDTSLDVLFTGMEKGMFTGVGLNKYFSAIKQDWRNARRIINGIDKADKIAAYAMKYHQCILNSQK